MDYGKGRTFLDNGYRLDLVRVTGKVVLCRQDGTEVARFKITEATARVIEQAAREDRLKRGEA